MAVVKKLLTTIDSELEKKGITKGDVAKALNVSGGTVTNYFQSKHNIGYMKFIELTKIAFNKYNHDFIQKFCEFTKRKVEVEALEWAYANGNVQILEILIAKGKKNNHYPAIFDVYELQAKRMHKGLKPHDFFKEYQRLKFGLDDEGKRKKKSELKSIDFETLILLEIFNMYALVDSAAYQAIGPIAQELLEQVENIESSYLKAAFTKRVELALIFSSMKSNDLHTAQEAAKQLINPEVYSTFPIHYNHALIYLAEIHVFTDFEKSSKYIKEAVKMINDGLLDENERQQKNIKSTYDFIHIFHNRHENLFLESLAEKAHLYAKGSSEDKLKALSILDRLYENQGKLTNFQTYYKALAKGDSILMSHVIDMFYLSADFHYVKLPKLYMKALVSRY